MRLNEAMIHYGKDRTMDNEKGSGMTITLHKVDNGSPARLIVDGKEQQTELVLVLAVHGVADEEKGLGIVQIVEGNTAVLYAAVRSLFNSNQTIAVVVAEALSDYALDRMGAAESRERKPNGDPAGAAAGMTYHGRKEGSC